VSDAYQLVDLLSVRRLDDVDEADFVGVEDALAGVLDPAEREALFEEVQVLPAEGVDVVVLALGAELPDLLDVEHVRVAA